MAGLVNYMERPAPSRLTPWPGNSVNEMCDESANMRYIASGNGREGKKFKACYNGKVYDFESVREGAEAMKVDINTLGRNINQKRVPQVDGIEWIEMNGEKYVKKKVTYNHRRIKAIINGEEIIFGKVVDAMDFFMVTRMTIHSWIRGGCLRNNGVSYIGYYE